MKKILILIFMSILNLYSASLSGIDEGCSGYSVDGNTLVNYSTSFTATSSVGTTVRRLGAVCSKPLFGAYNVDGSPVYGGIWTFEYNRICEASLFAEPSRSQNYSDLGKCNCPPSKIFNNSGSCVCLPGTESASVYSCITKKWDDACTAPCPPGTGRNKGGGCCPIGLDVFCEGTSLSSCKCPDGTNMIENQDGSFTCEDGCEDGKILSQDGTCRCPYDSIQNQDGTCQTCDFPAVATIQNECVDCGSGQSPDTNGICSDPCGNNYPYFFPISEDSSSLFIVPSSGPGRICYDGGNNPEDTSGDNISGSDTPDGITTETETITNDDGTTTTTETTTETITNDDGTRTTNTTTTTTQSDGTTNTTTTTQTSDTSNKEERNYDKAFEDIGDEIIKNRNEIKKSSNKNTEELQKIQDEIKKTNEKLSFDSTKIQDNFDPSTSEKQFDETSFTTQIEDKLNELQTSTTEKIDTVWDDIQTDVSNMVFIEVGTCQTLPTQSMNFHGQEVTFISQENFNIFFEIFRPIIIFIFTLSGLLYVYRAM